MIKRRKSKVIEIGGVKVGGDNPITVQSMCNTDTRDVSATVRQIEELQDAGCEIIRLAVLNKDAAAAIKDIVKKVKIPVIADIHFDYRLALQCIENGVAALRINPGNIGNEDKINAFAKACKNKNIPIRIGVNSGSVERKILAKYSAPIPEAMCESALYNAKLLEKFDFNDIVISIKSSSVNNMVKSYRLIAEKCSYPLHLGVTEAGTLTMGTIKSAIGIGSLLLDGIGDTIRVTLTDDPIEEVKAGFNILKALELRSRGITFISCPTCGRTRIDIIKIAKETQKLLQNNKSNLKVAIMGCVVNGPGEAKEADIGIAGGDGYGIIFKKGKVFKKVEEENLVTELINEINIMTSEVQK